MTRTLVLARHGQSVGNLQNIFTGWRDVDLTDQGRVEAFAAGEAMEEAGIAVEAAFCSGLRRAAESCRIMIDTLGLAELQPTASPTLNERDYGDLTGLNKDEARQRFGAEQVQLWRRSYEVVPPGGESLRNTVARVLPFAIHTILPAVMRGSGVLVVAHGNSLRALIMALDGLSADAIAGVELATGELRVYQLDEAASVRSRQTITTRG